jgi:hypothetical protein
MSQDLRGRIVHLTPGEALAVLDVLDRIVELIWDAHSDAIVEHILAEPDDDRPDEPLDDRIPF